MQNHTIKTKPSSLLVKGITVLAFPFALQVTAGCSMGQKNGMSSTLVYALDTNNKLLAHTILDNHAKPEDLTGSDVKNRNLLQRCIDLKDHELFKKSFTTLCNEINIETAVAMLFDTDIDGDSAITSSCKSYSLGFKRKYRRFNSMLAFIAHKINGQSKDFVEGVWEKVTSTLLVSRNDGKIKHDKYLQLLAIVAKYTKGPVTTETLRKEAEEEKNKLSLIQKVCRGSMRISNKSNEQQHSLNHLNSQGVNNNNSNNNANLNNDVNNNDGLQDNLNNNNNLNSNLV